MILFFPLSLFFPSSPSFFSTLLKSAVLLAGSTSAETGPIIALVIAIGIAGAAIILVSARKKGVGGNK
jgi:hypothetical protein